MPVFERKEPLFEGKQNSVVTDTLARATCTAPGATKGETAVVTCRYPLDVKQPGKMVSISVEHYPFISASPEFPSRDYLLECVWQEDGEEYCTVKKEEYRVEGKEVVITIKNVIEDNQGRYLCKMMVKDGPNIHGDACRLLVNGTNPSDLLPSTTDPALDQQTPRDNVTGSADVQMAAGDIIGIVAGIVVGCVVAVAVVLVLVCVCWRKCCLSEAWLMPGCTMEGSMEHSPVMECQTGIESLWHHLDHPHGASLTKCGHGHPAERKQPVEGEGNPLLLQPNQEGPGAEHQGDNDDDNRVDRPGGWVQREAKRIDDKPARSTSNISVDRPEGRVQREVNRIENKPARSTPDPRQQGSSDDRPESCVGKQVNRIEGEGAPSSSHPRASNEMEETEKAYGEEEKENDANETDDLFAHHMEPDAGKRRGPPAEGSIGKPTSGHKPLPPLQHNRNTPPPRHPTNHLSHSTPHPPAYDWTSPFIHRPDNHPTLVPRSTEHYPSIDHSSPINHMDVVAK